MPATAKPVAIGGCACTTACTSGRCRYTSRCISISDEGSRSPWSFLPVEIGDAHHVGRHEPLADALGRHQQPIGAEPHADVAVVRRGVAARVHAAADFDDVGAERGFGAHAVRAPVLVAAARRSRSSTLLASVGERHRAVGHDERAADRIAHHLDAALRHAARRRAAVPRTPSMMPSTQPPERARDEQDETRRAEDSRSIRHPASGRAAGRGMRRPQAVERALGRLAFGTVGRELRSTCCHACCAPSRSCLPNACTMPTFSSVLACFGSSFSEWSNCSSALSGWFV